MKFSKITPLNRTSGASSSSIIALCLFLFSSSLSFCRLIDKTIAAVDDTPILMSDLSKKQRNLSSKNYRELYGINHIKAKPGQEETLDYLIDEAIINDFIQENSLYATDEDIENHINNITIQNSISVSQLTQQLSMLGTTFPAYKIALKHQIERKNLLEQQIKRNVSVSEEEVLLILAQRNQKTGNKKVQTYAVSHILFESPDKAKKIHKQITENPSLFESSVKTHSIDTFTKDEKGLLGIYKKNDLSELFNQALGQVDRSGISPPIKSSRGFHILRFIEKNQTSLAEIDQEEVEAIRNRLYSEKIQEAFALWLIQKRNDYYVRKLTS